MSKVLKFNGNTNPKVETYKSIYNSYFKEQYIQGIKTVFEIINNNFEINDCSYDEVYNNILVFNGDRGTGKTSCMLSISKIIDELKGEIDKFNEFVDENSKYLNKYDCKKLLDSIEINELIDPAILNDESIVEIVVAQLLKKFKQKVLEGKVTESHRKELIKMFEKVFVDLKTINNTKDNIYVNDEDNLEVLLKLTSSIELKKNIKELIDKYFIALEMKEKVLVLQIDDLDLNLRKGNKIFEDIRRYLQIPNVVIMISMKIDQYKQIMDNLNAAKYRFLSQNEREKITIDYMEKIIPNNNIVSMPDIITDVEMKSTKCLINDTECNIEDYIVDIINEKTGYRFIKPKFGVSKIIPKTLREINILIKFLSELNEEEKEENFSKLCDYLIFIKYKKRLKAEHYSFILSLYNNRLTKCNKEIILFLSKILFKEHDDTNRLLLSNTITKAIKDISEESKVKSKNNNMEFIIEEINKNYSEANVSLGKVLRMFKISEIYLTNEYELELLECIKIVYSFILYKQWFNINEICGRKNNFSDEKINNNIEDKDNSYDFTKFQKLLGRDIYDCYDKAFDVKSQLYKLQDEIRLKNNFKTEISNILKSNSLKNKDKIDIIYLFITITIPYFPLLNTFIFREEEFAEYKIQPAQKNFIFNGSLILSNLFYSDSIFKFIRELFEKEKGDVDSELFKELEIRKNEIQTNIRTLIEKIPFYNVEFILRTLDYTVNESNKIRVKSGALTEFALQFIKIFFKCSEKVIKLNDNCINIENLEIYKILKNNKDILFNVIKLEENKVSNEKVKDEIEEQ